MSNTPFAYEKLCRAEFHVECMETSKRKWHEFNGLGLEEFVDFVAEKIGIEVWYTSLPKYGKHSDMLQRYYDTDDIRETDVPADFTKRFVERAHSHGILVVGAYKMNLFPALGRLKPGWLIRDIPDGREIEPNKKYFCHNTPFGDWLIEYLCEQVTRFDMDGVWFDDTQYSSRGAWPWPAGCLCDSCRELYRNETSRDLPERVDWDSHEFKEWVNWRYGNLTSYHRRIAEGVRKVRPDALVVYNSYPRATLHWSTANDLSRADPDLIYFIETEYKRMGPTLTAKIARARGNGEIGGWAPQLTGSLDTIGVAPYLDVEFCERFYLAGFANGVHVQGITDYIVPENIPGKPFKRLKELAPYFGGRSIHQCALLVSRRTRDFYYVTEFEAGEERSVTRGDTNDFWKQTSGVVEMLEQLHYQYDIVFEDSLVSNVLEPYRVLILPNSACLSDAAAGVITEWVRTGGTLVSTFESSLYDEFGDIRDNFALSEAFGIDYEGTYDKNGSGGTILVPAREMREELGNVVGFAGQHTLFNIKDETTTDVLATLASVTRFGPINFGNDSFDSGHPAMTRHRFGNGQAVYIAGDIGAGFRDHPLPRVRSLFDKCFGPADHLAKIEAPATLFASVFETESGTWRVHLYQRFSAMHLWDDKNDDAQQWSALSEPITCIDVKISVTAKSIASARLLPAGTDVAVSDGVVTVPTVRQYALVELRFRD